ncbi:CMRF35-like molecule 7 [Hemicordylus capensis]|uniref:CMRF35-like molecule 7 n=1 Tax=Hemicordylus capensis TaxID=884348 RepID=UPI0023037758|nr:CMRF35-like molecule 7 [Hemicordylus capensis]
MEKPFIQANASIALSFTVCWALEGPKTVTGPLGGSVTVHCQYKQGHEESIKFWCKEARRRFCASSHIIRTSGSEAEVKGNGSSIQDSHTLRVFRVTMESLTSADAGTYLCGVEKTGAFDIWFPVDVIITADSAASSHTGTKEQPTEDPSKTGFSTVTPERIQPSNDQFLLLLFLKISVLSVLIAIVVWVHACYRTKSSSNMKAVKTRGASDDHVKGLGVDRSINSTLQLSVQKL